MKILPIIEKPTITSFPSISTTFSILQTHEETRGWIYSNFIQLIHFKNYIHNIGGYFLDIKSGIDGIHCYPLCPFFEYYILNRDIVRNNWNSPTDFFKSMLDQNYYVTFWLNHADLFSWNISLEDIEHCINPTFIYGYDNNEEKIYTMDYYEDNIYQKKLFDFKVINKAASWSNFTNQEGYEKIAIIRFRNNIHYDFNLPQVIFSLEDYLNCIDSTQKLFYDNSLQYNYGISYYDHLIEQIENENLDIRMAHILLDHKILMMERVNYMKSIHLISENFDSIKIKLEELCNKTRILQNKIIKKKLGSNTNNVSLSHLVQVVKELKSLDEEWILRFLKTLKTNA